MADESEEPTECAAWETALRIPGARAVTVTAIDSRTPVWSSATDDQAPDDDGDLAAMAAAMAETAAELVRRTDPSTMMDDLLVTSAAWFHVLRVVGAPAGGTRVAHLVLDRRVANLAMARRDFRKLLEPNGPAVGSTHVLTAEPEVEPELIELPRRRQLPEKPQPLPQPGALPQRKLNRTRPDDGQSSYLRSQPEPPPAWFTSLSDVPFTVDQQTLDRLVDGLRRLP
jgi:hypothetical protein